MILFTQSPYEKLMMQRPKENYSPPNEVIIPKEHPCFGCVFLRENCVGLCHKEMLRYLEERRCLK